MIEWFDKYVKNKESSSLRLLILKKEEDSQLTNFNLRKETK